MNRIQKTGIKAIEIFLKALGLIPKKHATRLSNIMGLISYRIDKRHRKIAINNLKIAFGTKKHPREIKILAKRPFINLAMMIFETGWSLGLRRKDLGKYFVLKQVHNFKNACKQQKGVIILGAHFGSWELLPVAGAMLNHPINMIYRPLDNPLMDQFLLNIRSRFGGKTIRKRGSMKTIFQKLNKGEAVGIAMDQNVVLNEGVFVDFLGARACTSKGMALIAIASGAPIIPMFLIREGSKFTAEFGKEIPLIKTGDNTKDIEENTRQYNKVIEDFVLRYPNQWFWVHQRWKTKPYQPWPQSKVPAN